jgi:hypothetical protein
VYAACTEYVCAARSEGPNVVRYLAVSSLAHKPALVMELADTGLDSWIAVRTSLPPLPHPSGRTWLRHVLRAQPDGWAHCAGVRALSRVLRDTRHGAAVLGQLLANIPSFGMPDGSGVLGN